MSTVKHTKNELKTQRDALARYQRYLPTLQLKKQHLRLELRNLEKRINQLDQAAAKRADKLQKWMALFCEPFDFSQHLQLADVKTSQGNIAGVSIPVLEEVKFTESSPDLVATPPWIDDGIRALKRSAQERIEREILEEQQTRLAEELRVTNQRVNLFERVKIPEAEENIRVIRVFLGDQQTAAVARSKIAKGKTEAKGIPA